MKRALEALGLYARTLAPTETQKKGMEAITALDEALAQPQQEIVDIAALVEGMEVSIDVSTGDHDSGNRLFGSVTLVQENQGSKHGLILLVQDPEANFKTAAQQPAQPQQEPVARIEITHYAGKLESWRFVEKPLNAPLGIYDVYTSPPARKPLTDEEIKVMWRCSKIFGTNEEKSVALARAIEAAHNIKENT